jgi:hypothetical protein
MLRRLPLPARRAFRLALAAGLVTFAVHAAAIQLGFLGILVVLVLMSAPGPPPGLKAMVALVVIIGVTMLYGMLLGPVLIYARAAGVLLALVGVAAGVMISSRPGGGVIGTLVTLSSTAIAVVAAHSSAHAVDFVKALAKGAVIAIVAAQVAHAIFPEDKAKPAAAAPASTAPAELGWIALRSALIMLPPLILALSNPSANIMLLMRGSLLSHQANQVSARRAGQALIGSTLIGGLVALALWELLKLWPVLPLLSLSIALAVLLMARPMYGLTPSRLPPDVWQYAMMTAVILLGPQLGDTGTGFEIERKMLQRLAAFIMLAFYATFAVLALDAWRRRGLAARSSA